MDVSAIISEYGAYYLNQGQNAQRLYKKLYYENTFDEAFRKIESKETVLRFAGAGMSRLIQPFQKAWTPTGDITFTPAPINLYKMKVDFEDYPDELEESWLGFLAEGGLNRKDWPFIKWLLEEHLAPQVNQDIILNEAYLGEYSAPTPGTAGGAGEAMDGLKKIINDAITATTIAPIVIGAWSTDPVTFVEQLEETFIPGIDKRYRKRAEIIITMNVDLEERFKQGMIAKYNMNYDQTGIDRFRIHQNIMVKGEEGLDNSQKIWATIKNNQICAWKKGSNLGKFSIEQEDRKVKIFTDFWKGYGFIYPELVWTNNLELPA